MEIQRTSFCWFISEGLKDELPNFYSLIDFSGNIEFMFFGQEYTLIKPIYKHPNSHRNYLVELTMPLEIRNKQNNLSMKRIHLTLTNLPLMTQSYTFLINGCERVIVSQIIRSPGIYFEKNKKQKRQKLKKLVLSNEFNKARKFTKISFGIFKDPAILSNELKEKNVNQCLNFIELFKLYTIILKTLTSKTKPQRIKNIFKLLNIFKIKLIIKYEKSEQILDDINLIFKYISTYIILNNVEQNNKIDKIIKLYQQKIQKLITQNSIFVFYDMIKELKKIQDLNFLQNDINKKLDKLKINFHHVEKSTHFKTTIYFPIFKKYNRNNILKNKDYFEKNEIYKIKYEKKELYTATLIPEYGTWIRFSFLRDKKVDLYRYPITNRYEDDLVIQIDKISKKPISSLFREMGLEDLKVSNNLEHSDFLYFNNPLLTSSLHSNNPLLRFNYDTSNKNVSEFSRIFDSRYYRLGKIGRYKLNKRLNLKLSHKISTITYEDIFAIIDYLITASITKVVSDDIDHLKNRRIRSIGELIQQLFRIGFQRLSRKVVSQVYKQSPHQIVLSSNINLISGIMKEFFNSSELSQYMDQTNPLAALTHKRRISGLGPGGFDRNRISFAVRDIHPSHYGRICPIETPEGQNIGLISSITTCARMNEAGFLETPFWRVINGKVIKTENPIYLAADIEDLYRIAPADTAINQENYLIKSSISARYKQDFITVNSYEIDFIAISTIQIVSAAASLIPFFEHDDANRALMGSNMQRQSVPLLISQRPIIGTGLENQIAADSGMSIKAIKSGTVTLVNAMEVSVTEKSGRISKYPVEKFQRSNQETCLNQRPIVWKGQKVKSGQIIIEGSSINQGELSLGQNILIAYMPWQGYNFEDAILINERLVYDNVFTSIHIERYKINVNLTSEGREQTTNNIPNLTKSETKYLNEEGIVSVGTFVKPGDILLGKVTPNTDSEQLPEAKLLQAIFGTKSKGIRDSSFRMPKGKYGRIMRIVVSRQENNSAYDIEKVQIFVAQLKKIQVGDKVAGRHGNKGIVSRILPRQDMPFLPDGTPIDMILNPLGVPSRMNVGQLYECLLGLAGNKLNRRFKIIPFDEVYGPEVSRILINKKLREASLERNEAWLFNPYCPGKMVLLDGRTGKEFENPVTVGNAYILKLIHLVDNKMHARATGPYSLITQQPLRGKARQGGQRFGEMEVWALEGFGASYTLKELLTLKSDDMQGRNENLKAIVKGYSIPIPGIPESFKVLLQELRCIGLDISTYKLENYSSNRPYEFEVNLMEIYDPMAKTFTPTVDINNIVF